MPELQGVETVELGPAEDRLARNFGPSPPPVRVEIGAGSHVGLVRGNNEDHFVVIERRRSRAVLFTNLPQGFLQAADDKAYVLSVADGIGGAAFGELASMLALRSGWDQGPNIIKWTWVINDREIEEFREGIELIFHRADQMLQEKGQADPRYAGMGTTLTGAYTVGPEAFIAHVGDSRAYLYREGRLTQLTRDDTVAQDYLDAGLPVACRSWYHRLTNCLGGGGGAELRVEFHHFRLADGDQLLLCTDGLSDMVREEDIAGILARGTPPQETVHALIDKALQGGGKDNVTAVLARYSLEK